MVGGAVDIHGGAAQLHRDARQGVMVCCGGSTRSRVAS
jgi:hypothetical protein